MPSCWFSGELWPRRRLPNKIDFDGDATTRNSQVQRLISIWGLSWLAKNDAPTRARESIEPHRDLKRHAAPLFHPADFVPNLVSVSFLEQDAPHNQSDAGDNHGVVETSIDVPRCCA